MNVRICLSNQAQAGLIDFSIYSIIERNWRRQQHQLPKKNLIHIKT